MAERQRQAMNGVVFLVVFFCICIYHKKIQILSTNTQFQKCVLDTVLYLIQYYVFDTVSGVNTNPWSRQAQAELAVNNDNGAFRIHRFLCYTHTNDDIDIDILCQNPIRK